MAISNSSELRNKMHNRSKIYIIYEIKQNEKTMFMFFKTLQQTNNNGGIGVISLISKVQLYYQKD